MASERQMAGAAGFGGGQEPRNQQNSGAAGFGGGQEIPAVNNQQQQNWSGFGAQNYQGVGGQEQMRRPEGRPGDEEDVMYYYQTEQTQQPFATDTTGTVGEATGLGTVTEARVSEYFGVTDATTTTPTPTEKGTGAGDKYML